ncbi:MAG: acyl-CoA desaturase [Phycisphaerales bacterium]
MSLNALRAKDGATNAMNSRSETAVMDGPLVAGGDAQNVIIEPKGPALDYEKLSVGLRLANLGGVLFPFIGLVVAIVMLWGVAFDWVYLALMVGMYAISGFGITVGFHRYFTHKSFETSPVGVYLLAAAGSMAAQGGVIEWVADHRLHHQCSDDEHDPHSPHQSGSGIRGFLKGLWHSHMGWILRSRTPDNDRYVPDLKKDPLVCAVDRQFVMWVGIGLALPAVLGGLLTWSWMGVLLGFIWGGLVRVFLVHHVTWSVNSVCHIWGSRPYESHDHSRNNAVVGVLALGEGWHNNHHAFPTSARHGLSWWQIDTSYMLIRALEIVGLAWNLKVPTADRMEAKRRVPRA